MKKLAFAVTILLAAACAVCPAAAYEQPITQAEVRFAADSDLSACCGESDLGNLIADAMRAETGADIALLPGGMLTGALAAGSVFASDLERVLPTDSLLLTAKISAPALKSILELGLSHLATDASERIDEARSTWPGYLQQSGFTWEYDVSAPVGDRVTLLQIDGSTVDLSDEAVSLEIVYPAAMSQDFSEYALLPAGAPTGTTLRSAAEAYLSGQELLEKISSRTTVIGSASYPILGQLPIVAIVVVCIAVALLAGIPRNKEKKHFSFSRG